MRVSILVVVLSVSGCELGPCEEPSGSYRLLMTTRSGDCTTGSRESVITAGQVSPPDPSCNDTYTAFDPTTCQATLHRNCNQSSGGILTMRALVDWNRAGTEATGIMEMSATGQYACQGTMGMTYTKL